MTDCRDCKYAKWDYEDYYNTPYTQWFICGCMKDLDDPNGGDCKEFEENDCV